MTTKLDGVMCAAINVLQVVNSSLYCQEVFFVELIRVLKSTWSLSVHLLGRFSPQVQYRELYANMEEWKTQRPMKCSFYMSLCCSYVSSSASLHVSLINNAVLRFRFGEKENQCTFVLHERAFDSVCLFSDNALGKRLQHKRFTATCAWVTLSVL